MKKKIIVISVTAVVIVLMGFRLAANYAKIEESKTARKSSLDKVAVTTGLVEKKSINETISAVGTTAGNHEVILQAEIPAQIAELHFALGDYVRKGQLLVQLNDRSQALACENAKLNLSRLEDDFNRTKGIYAGKAGTETQLRDSKTAYENAKIALEQAKRQLDFTRITAPFDGCIYQNFTEKGAFVGVGGQLLALADISQLKVNLTVAEKDVYRMKTGLNARLTAQVFPGIEYKGKITFISQKADKWHNYAVEVTMNNSKDHQLRSGTFVNVNFDLGGRADQLLIPRKSLVGSMKNASVFVVNNNLASLKNITIGSDYGDYLQVASGLEENDEIVLTGQINLYNGAKISK